MADFPALEPSRRSYDFGFFLLSKSESLGSSGTRFLHGETAIGHQVSLLYENITHDEMLLIRIHRRGQNGGNISFLLPAIIWQGHPVGGILPVVGRWKYAGIVAENRRTNGNYDVTVPLQYVGIEPAPMN